MDEAGIILLVEDNLKILDLNRRMLEQEGCMVLTAETLAQARQRLKTAVPDVAVLDVMLPDGSGLEFLSELREVSDAPVLFLTAKADREDIMAGLAAGGNDYITKPYNIDEFRMRIKGFLRLVAGGRDKRAQRQAVAYLPDRLRGRLEQISRFPLTTIVAPAGYGKTTAVRAFADTLPPESLLFRLSVLSGNASDFWRDFTELFAGKKEGFAASLQKNGIPADLPAQREFLRLTNDALGDRKADIYVFIDDFQLVTDPLLRDFFLFAGRHLPEGVHIVILSRTPVFEQDSRFLLSGKIHEITEHDLWYGPKETKEYFALCGCPIGDEDAARLSEQNEGWIAALYLNMKSYAETGRFSEARDIHSLMEAALYNPLSQKEKELLAALSLFESFDGAQSVFVSEMPQAEEMLQKLLESNSFITREEPGGAYKLHHMFREVVRENFGKFPPERRRQVIRRAGLAHVNGGKYLLAARLFYAAGDFENLLLSLEQDYGASLAGEHKAEFLAWYRDCPRELLYAHPLAMLICARRLYLYNMRAPCEESLAELRRSLTENTRLSARERENLRGEIEIAASMLCYNNAAAMGIHYKRALELMDRPTNSVSPFVPWTYGTPSVFTAYHRSSGEADAENAAMKEAMPAWYRLNRHHGAGAEHLFEGELYFLRGNFTDGSISLHRALHEAKQNRQPVMALAADFLRLRIETFGGNLASVEPTLQSMRSTADEHRVPMLLHTADICEAWISALTGQPDKAALWIADGNLEDTRVLFPGIHFLHMVYCQLLLAQGEYAALIAHEDEKRALYKVYPTLLCEIYLDIQLAAAYERLGRRENAQSHLKRALEMAAPDEIYLPFAENGNYIIEPLREMTGGAFGGAIERILALQTQNRLEKKEPAYLPQAKPSLDILTEREAAIARLAAAGMSNKEIAAELFISESRVKGQLSGIFQKLGIANGRDKRGALATMFPSE